MVLLRRLALALLGRFGAQLRYPHLFLIAAGCFVLDLVLPDGIPFLDEIFFGLLALFFARWKNRGEERGAEPMRAPKIDILGPEPR